MGNRCCKSMGFSVETSDHDYQLEEVRHEREIKYGVVHVHATATKIKDDLASSGYSTSSNQTERRYSTERHEEFPNAGDIQQSTREFASNEINESKTSNSYFDDYNENHIEESGLRHDEQVKIKRNFSYLKKNLDPEFLLDYFLRDEIFTDDQAEEVVSCRFRGYQADLLIRFLLTSRKSSSYSLFLDILNETRCGHIRRVLELEHVAMPLPDYRNVNSQAVRADIESTRPQLVSAVSDPTRIAEYFVQHEEFSIEEYELIIQEKTRKLKMERLLDTALQKDNIQRCYSILNYALAEEGYTTLNDPTTRTRNRQNAYRERVADPGHSYVLKSDPDHTASSSQKIADVEAMRFSLNIVEGAKKKRRKEKKAVKKANRYKTKLNDALVRETECQITDIETGSIVIQIKGCKKGSLSRLMEMGTEDGISKILHIFLSHPDLCTLFKCNTIFQVTVHGLPTPPSTSKEESLNPKKIITSNFDFLVEELDALRFLDLGIFTEEEETDILQARTRSRAEGTKILLEYAQMKSENELNRIIDEIKQRKPFVWDHICSSEVLIQPKDGPNPTIVVLFRGTYSLNVCKPTGSGNEETSSTIKDNASDTESGYQSLSLGRRSQLSFLFKNNGIGDSSLKSSTERSIDGGTQAEKTKQMGSHTHVADGDETEQFPLNLKRLHSTMAKNSKPVGTDSEYLLPVLTPLKEPRCFPLVDFDEGTSSVTSASVKSWEKIQKQDESEIINKVCVTPREEGNTDLHSIRRPSCSHSTTLTRPRSTGLCVTSPSKTTVPKISDN